MPFSFFSFFSFFGLSHSIHLSCFHLLLHLLLVLILDVFSFCGILISRPLDARLLGRLPGSFLLHSLPLSFLLLLQLLWGELLLPLLLILLVLLVLLVLPLLFLLLPRQLLGLLVLLLSLLDLSHPVHLIFILVILLKIRRPLHPLLLVLLVLLGNLGVHVEHHGVHKLGSQGSIHPPVDGVHVVVKPSNLLRVIGGDGLHSLLIVAFLIDQVGLLLLLVVEVPGLALLHLVRVFLQVSALSVVVHEHPGQQLLH